MTTRQPIKSVNKSAAAVTANAAAEKARKAASKAALKAALAAQNAATYGGPAHPETPQPAPVAQLTPDALAAKRATERAAALAAWRVDAIAVLGDNATEDAIAAYIAEQDAPAAKAAGYTGPMLALRKAALGYTKGANGNPHCNDAMAQALDGLSREQVVAVLIAAMKLPGNPYLQLNPGQQSMNLRNKARGMLKNGFIKTADVAALRDAALATKAA